MAAAGSRVRGSRQQPRAVAGDHGQPVRPPVGGLIELLLRERRQQKPHALELLRIEDPVQQLVEVLDRQEFPP